MKNHNFLRQILVPLIWIILIIIMKRTFAMSTLTLPIIFKTIFMPRILAHLSSFYKFFFILLLLLLLSIYHSNQCELALGCFYLISTLLLLINPSNWYKIPICFNIVTYFDYCSFLTIFWLTWTLSLLLMPLPVYCCYKPF